MLQGFFKKFEILGGSDMKKSAVFKKYFAFFIALFIMLNFTPLPAAEAAENAVDCSNSYVASAYDVVDALYRMDDEPLMIDQIENAAHMTYVQDPLAWSEAYDILPDGIAPSTEVTLKETAEIIFNHAKHHDIDVSIDIPLECTTFSSLLNKETATALAWAQENDVIDIDTYDHTNENAFITLLDLSLILDNYENADLDTVGVISDGLTLTYPSENQMTINPLCDFYVIGNIDDSVSIPDDALLTVQMVDSEGTILREIYTDIKNNQSGMYVDYPGIEITGSREAFRSSLMPDLVYDPSDPSSFDNTWIKACYSDEHYTCVVYGGSYRQDINPLDQFGKTLEPLPEGDYELSVTFASHDETIASLETQITIGVVAKKVLARFSPSSYLRAVKEYAAENGLTVYADPFPGYWNTQDLMPEWGVNYLGVIEPRWVLADRQGYIGGMTYFFDYNITASSTSYRVELGQLAYDRTLNNRNNITYCYYNIGEPQIIQDGITYNGHFVTVDLDNMDSVRFTRADCSFDETQENHISPEILANSKSQFDLDERFLVSPGEIVSLNGICKVIQPENVTFVPDTESFIMGNKVAGIRYTIKYATGETYMTMDKPVSGLVREFENGTTSISILEFRHNFTVEEDMRGNDMRIVAEALDEDGEVVGGIVYACMFRVPRS